MSKVIYGILALAAITVLAEILRILGGIVGIL